MMWQILLIVTIFPLIWAQSPYRPKTVGGDYCNIPFENNGKVYHECTSEGATKPFCKKSDNSVEDCASGPDFSSCSVACPTANISEVQSILNLLNDIRSKEPALRMAKLRWNTELAKRSQYMSNQCTIENNNTNLCTSPSSMGQISYMTSSSVVQSIKWTEFLLKFYGKKSSYDIDTDSCTADNCNGYKQLVNSKTMDVGCAVSSCSVGGKFINYYFCTFYPPFYNGKPYDKGAETCDSCYKLSMNEKFRCTNNLCEQCDVPTSDCIGYASSSNCVDTDPTFCASISYICPSYDLLPAENKQLVLSKCGKTCKLC